MNAKFSIFNYKTKNAFQNCSLSSPIYIHAYLNLTYIKVFKQDKIPT